MDPASERRVLKPLQNSERRVSYKTLQLCSSNLFWMDLDTSAFSTFGPCPSPVLTSRSRLYSLPQATFSLAFRTCNQAQVKQRSHLQDINLSRDRDVFLLADVVQRAHPCRSCNGQLSRHADFEFADFEFAC